MIDPDQKACIDAFAERVAKHGAEAFRVLHSPVNQSAVDYARGLLARCESGEVVGVTAIEELAGGTYKTLGSTVKSRHATAGMLLDAAVTRLQQD